MVKEYKRERNVSGRVWLSKEWILEHGDFWCGHLLGVNSYREWSKRAIDKLLDSHNDSMKVSSYHKLLSYTNRLLLPEKGKGSKQKTSVCRKTLHPTWNHTLVFDDTSLQDLSDRALELSVWDHDRLAPSQFLGGCRLSLGHGEFWGDEGKYYILCHSIFFLWVQFFGNIIHSTEAWDNIWQSSEELKFWIQVSLCVISGVYCRCLKFLYANTVRHLTREQYSCEGISWCWWLWWC